ncbi:hypothetical protein ScPMuIL_013648 [Solemya velum]
MFRLLPLSLDLKITNLVINRLKLSRRRLTSAMPTILPPHSDWQTGKTLLECTEFMLKHEIACDVTFLVGTTGQAVRAHTFIMISRSPIFAAMFCSPKAETQKPILIPDMEPKTFESLLRYMYSDRVSLSKDNVGDVLQAANKYCVHGLSEICRRFLKENLDVDNACFFLQFADRSNEDNLFKMFLDFILENGDECLKSPSFCEMSRYCVEKVIEADDLMACELDVWKALVRWAEAECERKGVTTNDDNIRHAMGNLIYLVRFLRMNSDMFAQNVATNDILTTKEVSWIFRFHHHAIGDIGQFSNKTGRPCFRRTGDIDIVRCIRLQQHPGSQWWGYSRGLPDGISFTVTRPVLFCGIVLYGCRTTKSQYEISINLTDSSDTQLLSDDMRVETNPDVPTFDILFRKKIELEQNKQYNICVSIKGERSYFGELGRQSVTTEGVTFSFTNYTGSGNETNVEQGQIPGLLFQRCSESSILSPSNWT